MCISYARILCQISILETRFRNLYRWSFLCNMIWFIDDFVLALAEQLILVQVQNLDILQCTSIVCVNVQRKNAFLIL